METLPAAAVDNANFGLWDSWEKTKGSTFSIWLAFVLVALLAFLLDWVLQKLFGAAVGLNANIFLTMVYEIPGYLIFFLGFIVNATIMSFAYQELVETAEPSTAD